MGERGIVVQGGCERETRKVVFETVRSTDSIGRVMIVVVTHTPTQLLILYGSLLLLLVITISYYRYYHSLRYDYRRIYRRYDYY